MERNASPLPWGGVWLLCMIRGMRTGLVRVEGLVPWGIHRADTLAHRHVRAGQCVALHVLTLVIGFIGCRAVCAVLKCTQEVMAVATRPRTYLS